MPVQWKNRVLVAAVSLFLGGFMLWSIGKPLDAESVSERRPLAGFPALSGEAVLSGRFMKDFEQYTLDQFPMRDGFRTIKAAATLYLFGQRDNNKIYIQDGFASRLDYPLNRDSIAYAASRFEFIYDRYLKGRTQNVFLSVIPDKNYFMAEKNGYPCLPYDTLVASLRERMEFARYIDLFPSLQLSDYYRTDPHWRQEGLVEAAQCLGAGMGVDLSAEYTVQPVEAPFYGAYYGQSALPLPPDELYYLSQAFLEDCRVYDYEAEAYIPLYDQEKAGGRDPYEMFLAGPKPLITIENPRASSGKELILFRDSFASSIAPLLAEGYAAITLVDVRYISPQVLDTFIEFGNQDVLFLYSTSVLNNSATIK